MRPLDKLVMPCTGSMASKVAPTVSNTRLPASSLGVYKSGSSPANSAALNMRPLPVSPQTWLPLAGPNTVMPSACS